MEDHKFFFWIKELKLFISLSLSMCVCIMVYFNWNRHIFFVTLLSIQESSFSAAFRMFDKDNDGSVLMLPSLNVHYQLEFLYLTC